MTDKAAAVGRIFESIESARAYFAANVIPPLPRKPRTHISSPGTPRADKSQRIQRLRDCIRAMPPGLLARWAWRGPGRETALAYLAEISPDIKIADLSLGSGAAAEVAKLLQAAGGTVRTIAVAMGVNREAARQLTKHVPKGGGTT